MTTRERAEKAAAETYPRGKSIRVDEFLSFEGQGHNLALTRGAFVDGWEAREALLPSVEEVAHQLAALDPYAAGPDAMHREMARAVLRLVKGEA